MRTVITISLNGNAYQLDAGGFEAMRAYLQVAEQRLAGNPDQGEILADLEQAIADKCRRYLGPHKNVVSAEEVAAVLKEMGPVDGGASEGAAMGASAVGATAGAGAGSAAAGGWGVGGSAAGTDGGFAAGASAGTGQNGESDSTGVGGVGGPAVGGAATGSPGAESTGGAWGSGAGNTSAGASGAWSSGAGGTGAGASGPWSSGASSGASAGSGGAMGTGPGGTSTAGQSGEAPRRLYQIREGAVISGVCKGLAAYLNIDVSIIRILFVALVILTGGVWILIYIVMMFVIPYAQTSEQHAEAHGWPFNAEELVARAKAHYAQFRENGAKWQRRQYKEQRRAWRTQHKAWKEQQRHWERWGGLNGPPPPPPPPPGWVAGQPPNPSYQAQLLNGVISPILAVVGVLVGFTFLFMLLSLIRHHTIFGWWWPHEIPMWVGIVFLVVLYRAITSPLHQARYSAYYGAPVGHAWVALIGALVWLALLSFLAWEAWQHWDDVADFFQRVVIFWQDLIERRATSPGDAEHAALYFLAWGVPSCVLPGYVAARELESHGEIDGMDVLGEAADGNVVDTGFGNGAYSLE